MKRPYEANSGLFFRPDWGVRAGSSVDKDIFGRGVWGASSVPPQRLRVKAAQVPSFRAASCRPLVILIAMNYEANSGLFF